MKTTAVRLYGKMDLRMETFELPEIKDDEILARVVSDSVCMSSYKAAVQGADHKRVPPDIDKNPIIIGHEFCGVLLKIGKKWRHRFNAGEKFAIQPAINYNNSPYTPGYAYPHCGGAATAVILPNEVMEKDCLLPFNGEGFFYGSLAEPMSCIVGTYHAMYHTVPGVYEHSMGIRANGKMALLAGAGPMGLGAIDYALHAPLRPKLLVVTDVDQARLDRAASLYPPEEGARMGVDLRYINTREYEDPVKALREIAGGGYDDVMVYAPVQAVVEQGDQILGHDGCLNFFAGPTDTQFSAKFNFYNVHYASTHLVGTSGGNTADMLESLEMMADGRLNPASMITHVGGLNCAAQTTLALPKIPGGKKLIYTGIRMPLTAIADFEASEDPLLMELDNICKAHNGLWCAQAEKLLLEKAPEIGQE